MKRLRWFAWGAAAALSLFVAGIAARAQQQEEERPRVVGMFDVAQTADLGEEVRIEIHVRLVNAGESDVSNAKATLHSSLPKAKEEIAPVFVKVHSDAEFTQEFTVPRAELELLQREPRLLLVLQFQGQDGHEVGQIIRLRRTALPTRER